jgi:sulfonate transport system ATP-binding protein
MNALPQASAADIKGAAISIRHVGRKFASKTVLTDLKLDIEPGEFVAVVGQSGCGKSTLLRIIAGLDDAYTGKIVIESEGRGTASARIMYQEPRLLPWASVIDNVAMGLGPDITRQVALIRARKALDPVGLGDRGSEWPHVLSGGQKQRVALARALVSRPDVLVLDEPLGALDALTRIEMQQLLERVWLEEGFTALLVTHDVVEALTLADRVVLIEQGEIALDFKVPFPRPRKRSSVPFVNLEERLLAALLHTNHQPVEYVI